MSSKAATVTVLYPKNANSTFDLKYYLSTHMPMVGKAWTKHGLKNWSVTELEGDSPYSIMAAMEFESSEAWGNAQKDEGTGAIMKDVENFSNEKPILINGNIVGSS
ncbi:hypothetical protein BCR34DRAFT_198642 [Clohesyomyces aquaticus]|uniref:EthD domain-containing protein n=1 Tax=Clohesyomyces aquaticus TaxID=1231657 RepID=A0A1Y1ZY03_9PLEO|nr:hypothetical protein BCR34DRAFT_198642 [Clohesyomyces aquaticus]